VPVASLLIDAPGANTLKKNRDLFVRRASVPALGRAAAAMALFTVQTYAPSGGAGHRTSLRGGGPLTSLVLPPADDGAPSLWRTVWLNAYWAHDWSDPFVDLGGVFPWLTTTRTSEAGETTTPGDVHPAQCFWGMPRRIRLDFTPREDGTPRCAIGGRADDVMVATYRTRPHGTNYEAWYRGHPLSPYYRQKKDRPEWLPAHPQPGHGGYRDWVGLVVADADDESATRAPARAVSRAFQRLREIEARGTARLWVGGYDMDNMTARGLLDSQLPVPAVSAKVEHTLDVLSRRLVFGAQQAENLTSYAIASALTPDETKSDKGARRVARERFWERTEPEFFALLREVTSALEAAGDAEQRGDVRERAARSWLAVLERAALDLFDAFVPPTEIGALYVRRVVEARRTLRGALRGYGAGGKRLFEALQLPRPEAKPKKEKVA
jgi:CRISPR system Cascade subunit CasA